MERDSFEEEKWKEAIPEYLMKCYECNKDLDKNDIERSKVFDLKSKGIKVRICEECFYSIVENYLDRRYSED